MKRRTTILLMVAFIGATLVACLSYDDEMPPFCFQWCMEGPNDPCQRGCEGYDYDDDMDVDLRDWAQYTLECPGMPPC